MVEEGAGEESTAQRPQTEDTEGFPLVCPDESPGCPASCEETSLMREEEKVIWKEYPDPTIRHTYPPLPKKGRSTHIQMPDQVGQGYLLKNQSGDKHS